ncbi:hypothetical protein D3D02_03020 [Halobellus sp. Atlit-38R]|uniref:hypothetical protein n=1 Tax=Halobellus sp. Atlit-38R TaxID=2282131 RepID=UPI000EF28F7A|nr:hypothetical protein [Halobellus sp. Atlit-38R]RLM90754.1 hypothetical protein D3D02_03020 [Halobellus sp. Atlit-38R]
MVDSDWWVGVALPPVLEVVGWLGLVLTPESSGSATTLGLIAGVLVVVSQLLIPVFAAALYFDARAVARSAETWVPRPRIWGGLGIAVPIVGLVLADSPLLVFVASAYLLRRFRSSDAGSGAARDVYSGDGWYEGDRVRDEAGSDDAREAPERISRWYYGVALTVAAFLVVVVATPGLVAVMGMPENARFVYETIPTVGVFLPFAVVFSLVASVLLIPVFSLSLFLDTRRIRESDVAWAPDRRVWGAVAVVHLCNVLVPLVWLLSVPAGGYYLWLRRQQVGRP